jgi:hypothetical protein
MKLSINLVTGGKYVRAGDPLPPDFELPSHLEAFAIYDEPPQASRADLRLSSVAKQQQRDMRAETQLAKPATDYPEGEEEFTPKWMPKKKGKL